VLVARTVAIFDTFALRNKFSWQFLIDQVVVARTIAIW
jgi:hypothetical protein